VACSVCDQPVLYTPCRCGVDTSHEAAKLAEHISRLSSQQNGSVNFRGIQAYHGGLQHVRDPQQRAAAVQAVVDRAAAAVDAISSKAGLKCQVVTGGGSGTYRLEAGSGVFTEVQPGG
jgi:D-serine deaminase-like pyridoxal phosphate-dependent protein